MTDTKDCPNCSATLPAGATFCTSCGTRIGEGGHAAPPTDSAPAEDATRVDNPGLGDSTQVFSPPPAAPPEPNPQPYAPPSAPWQPADAPSAPPAGPPSPPSWNPPGNPQAPAWQQPQPAAPAQGWGAPPGAAPQWGAPAPASTGNGTQTDGSPIGGVIAMVGGVLALVGLFTAWVGSNQTDATTSGWDLISGDKGLKSNDPYLILALGIGALVIGLLLFTGVARPLVRIAAVVVGVAVIAVALRDWLSIVDLVKDASSDVEITAQFGFYLTIAGGIVTAAAALLPAQRKT